MNPGPLPWALLVVANSPSFQAAPLDPPAAVLGRALALSSLAKTCCLIEARFRPEWDAVTQQLWPRNVQALLPTQRVVDAVIGRLSSISRQEPEATLILIPYNHCAVEELTWLDSAQGALRLAAAHRNTVYLLHDNPDNDPRVSVRQPEVCSSSVLVGGVTALAALCRGERKTTVTELVLQKPAAEDIAVCTDALGAADAPLNLVHVRLVEEYARLQRDEIWHRATHQVDVRA